MKIIQRKHFFLIFGFLTFDLTKGDELNHTSYSDVSQYQRGGRNNSRTFIIDYDNDTFKKDGKPFQYVAGSVHYFRTPHEYWRDRLRATRAAGLNAVSTYVEWSFHEPEYRQYNWTGDQDLVKFIEIAHQEDLLVILRPGPYICAERDMGGFPYWLLTKYPNILLRTKDEDYKWEVTEWYKQLMSRVKHLFYGNGGPIIMVQVENEYGSFDACDREYMAWLADLTAQWVDDAAVLFTTDGCGEAFLRCGVTPGVYATVDFGAYSNTKDCWNAMRKYSPKGPLINSEYYPGWLTHWGEKMADVSADAIVKTMDKMFKDHANFNFYMFHGGTNFGFTAGANLGPGYAADITSYDYDAPLTEAGDPTPKYLDIRKKIGEYMTLPDTPLPQQKPKGAYGNMAVNPLFLVFSPMGQYRLAKKTWHNNQTITMEAAEQYSGLLLYQTVLTKTYPALSILSIPDLRDRGYVYLNGSLAGILSRYKSVYNMILTSPVEGTHLQIFVENQGRVNFKLAEDYKGIGGNVLLNGEALKNWTMITHPLDDFRWAEDNWVENVGRKHLSELRGGNKMIDGNLTNGPVLYTKRFQIQGELLDTYIDPTGWGKGYIWINNRCLGRYWPSEGPQVTLYLPGVYLNGAPSWTNTLVILELEKAPKNKTIVFTNKPNLGKETESIIQHL